MSTLLPLYLPYWAVLRIKQDGRCDYALKIVKCDKDMMFPYLYFYLHVSFFFQQKEVFYYFVGLLGSCFLMNLGC